MRMVGYQNCCGAYFLFDLTVDDLKLAPKTLDEFPQKKMKDTWNNTDYYAPDPTAAPVAYAYLSHNTIAYWLTILDKEENKKLKDLLALHDFKLISSTKERFLYARCRGSK